LIVSVYLYPNGYKMLSQYLKSKRKESKLTQEDLALKAGVGLRVLREMEQGKATLRMDKVNQVLALFGCELGVVRKKREEPDDV
jgi:y4mF family transcriptional regulator